MADKSIVRVPVKVPSRAASMLVALMPMVIWAVGLAPALQLLLFAGVSVPIRALFLAVSFTPLTMGDVVPPAGLAG